MKNIRGITLYTPYPTENQYVPVLSFNLNKLHSMEAAEQLNQAGFALRAGLHCAPAAHRRLGTISYGTIRMATSVFNKPNEVNTFLSHVSRMAKTSF
jgi:selenocysteine lyase/cysteine desulfurase